MAKSLKPALARISATYHYTMEPSSLPPDRLLATHVLNFVNDWKAWLNSREDHPDNPQCVKDFFDKIVAICQKFPAYDRPQNAAHINVLNTVIMLCIPWEYLPEEERRERLKVILQNKKFRFQLWRHHLELLNQNLAENPSAGLAMNSHLALALLEHEDLRAELIALPLQQISVFFEWMPDLLLKMPTLYAELSAEKQQAFLRYQLDQSSTALHTFIKGVDKQFKSYNKTLSDEHALEMLVPLTKDNVELSVRSRANFVVASIHIARHEKASAKPYLATLTAANPGLSEGQRSDVKDLRDLSFQDPLTKANWGLSTKKREAVVGFRDLCAQEEVPEDSAKQLIALLNQLNKSLERYLCERDLNSIMYSLGFFNTKLSAQKNTLVKGLRKNIDAQIANLGQGKYSEDSATELLHKLSDAEKQNGIFHRDYARRIELLGIEIDGRGKLGADLHAAAESIKKFIPDIIAEPDSPTGSHLKSD